MGERVVKRGLYFPLPCAGLDVQAANDLVASEMQRSASCRGLMIIRPDDDPVHVETQLQRHRFDGFKVYHLFAARPDTFHATQDEFLPPWAWELAHTYRLVIMMHLVRAKALSDQLNQSYIQSNCRRYPNAKLILAHAARGFNANHTINAISNLRGLENVWFDSSAVCEPSALEAIIENFGTTRLLYGSDFPVSELRGRCVSVGDGFYWLHDNNAKWDEWLHGSPQLIGIESLIALRQACRRMKLIDRDVERIFCINANELFDLDQISALRPDDHQSATSDLNETLGHQRYREAKRLIPGGTQLLSKRPEMFAPGKWPAYFEQAIGCEVTDVDGRRYVDMSHGGILSCILGYADPDVNAAVMRRVQLGSMSTQQTTDEVDLAQLLIEIHPWADQARFARTGGEAMAIAVRIARASTAKDKVVVCGYHGWHDWYLAANLSPKGTTQALDAHLLPGLHPTGVPVQLADTVETFSYNHIEELDAALARCEHNVAAIVMEPTRHVDPLPGFLAEVKERAKRCDALLVFDEISSAWRYHLGGIHLHYGVSPDIAVFAKAMSNGFAMSAVIGRRAVMETCHESFISSTYWTEGIGPAAALATITKLKHLDAPRRLEELGTRVIDGWRRLQQRHRLPLTIGGRPASATLSFVHPQNDALLTLLTTRMLDHGFLACGSCSLTLAHQYHHIDRYLEALDIVFHEISEAIRHGDVTQRLDGPVKHSGFKRLTD